LRPVPPASNMKTMRIPVAAATALVLALAGPVFGQAQKIGLVEAFYEPSIVVIRNGNRVILVQRLGQRGQGGEIDIHRDEAAKLSSALLRTQATAKELGASLMTASFEVLEMRSRVNVVVGINAAQKEILFAVKPVRDVGSRFDETIKAALSGEALTELARLLAEAAKPE
jgi:hypothetical protein